MYNITFSRQATRHLRRIPQPWQGNILSKIEDIAECPYAEHHDVRKLFGREGYRLRVGSYRVLYTIESDQLSIHILDLGPRGSIYQ